MTTLLLIVTGYALIVTALWVVESVGGRQARDDLRLRLTVAEQEAETYRLAAKVVPLRRRS